MFSHIRCHNCNILAAIKAFAAENLLSNRIYSFGGCNNYVFPTLLLHWLIVSWVNYLLMNILINGKDQRKNLSKQAQNSRMNWISDKNFICPVLPIIESKHLNISIIYISSILNTTLILEISFVFIFPPIIPSTIYLATSTFYCFIFPIRCLFSSTLADS